MAMAMAALLTRDRNGLTITKNSPQTPNWLAESRDEPRNRNRSFHKSLNLLDKRWSPKAKLMKGKERGCVLHPRSSPAGQWDRACFGLALHGA